MSILTFYNAQKKDRKIDNWLQIQKCKCFVDPVKICKSFAGFCFDVGYILVLARKKFKLTQEEYESIANLGPETAQSLLFRLYEFLTGEKVNV